MSERPLIAFDIETIPDPEVVAGWREIVDQLEGWPPWL